MDDLNVDYEIRYSSRASKPRIDVDIHGMTVVVPKGMNLDPEELVEANREWVEEKLRKFKQRRSRIPERRFEEGAVWPYRGEEYLLRVNAKSTSMARDGMILLSGQAVDNRGIKDVLEDFYRTEAREFIEERVRHYAEELQVDYNTIRIKNQKTLWGSCSSKSNLNFNWRLMMAPPDKAEYVILHELCHLRQASHSASFWNLVEQYCEDPKEKARWLKEHSVELIFTRDDL